MASVVPDPLPCSRRFGRDNCCNPRSGTTRQKQHVHPLFLCIPGTAAASVPAQNKVLLDLTGAVLLRGILQRALHALAAKGLYIDI